MEEERIYDVLIIGAGAAGLAAAYELSLVNKNIIVLEARDRIGGRIHSIRDDRFRQVVELGAEFIHGKLPLTTRLLDKAGIKHHEAEGKMWQVKKGQLEKSTTFIEGWDKLMRELKKLKEDVSIAAFLDQHFAGEADKDLRESVLRFVEGYDAADSKKASAIALRQEWENEDDNHQGRIDEGYTALLQFLSSECERKGNTVLLSKPVQKISWQKSRAEVLTKDGQKFTAAKVLLTLPLGLWQSEENNIRFTPELSEKKEAAKKMGYGAVIKFNLQFADEFWHEEDIPHQTKKAGFIFSDAELPTWWTQYPRQTGLLTGWLAGPKAYALKEAEEQKLYQLAIQSLAYIFGVSTEFIIEKLTAYQITNWASDPFSCGAYSYPTLDTEWAKKVLSDPLENTLFFSGEALYEGSETGTVEAAFVSGTETARKIIAV